jgi:hypothetical protein
VVKKIDAGYGYKPINMPTKYQVVPMPAGPAGQDEDEA